MHQYPLLGMYPREIPTEARKWHIQCITRAFKKPKAA